MGLREANQRFSLLVKAVKQGKQVVLTDRGRPLAIVRPLVESEGIANALERLEGAGVLRTGKRPGPLRRWKPLRIKRGSINATLREDRDRS